MTRKDCFLEERIRIQDNLLRGISASVVGISIDFDVKICRWKTHPPFLQAKGFFTLQ